MPVIDADTHVTECDDTFSYVQESEQRFVPTKGEMPRGDGLPPRGYWLIDGMPRMRSRWTEGDEWKVMGELLDVPARVRAMQQMGVETQVIYPTMFSAGGIRSSEVELALLRSYNRWLADKTSESGGRLRWIMLPPLQNIDRAIEELRFAKDHGAVGVLKKGDEEAGHWPAEPYFYPFYAEAERLNMPICFHVGTGFTESLPLDRLAHISLHKFHMSAMSAFCSLITFQVPSRFPGLRWGFIEITASWVPFALYYMRRILVKSDNKAAVSSVAGSTTYEVPNDVLAKNNMYVSCFVDEDLPTIIKHTGDDNLLMGSDFVHHDHAEELDFIGAMNERVNRGELSASTVRKITYDNPRAFYAL
jgi:predicted TIM-barrel fold metal-dependent hydrolase